MCTCGQRGDDAVRAGSSSSDGLYTGLVRSKGFFSLKKETFISITRE